MKPSTVFLFTALATAFACASSEDPGGDGSSPSSASSGGPGGEASQSSSSSSSASGTGAVGGGDEGGAGGARPPTGGAATGGAGGEGGDSGGNSGTGGNAGAGGGGGCSALSGCAIDDPNPATRCSGVDVVTPIVAPAGAVWATSVVAFSSEYTATDWSATQATGPANTYPDSGDEVTAWASLLSSAPDESITLAFTPPVAGSQIWIFETYNPDAVETVTVSTASGDTVVYQVVPTSVGDCAYVLGVPTNTTDPVTQVKIDLASDLVVGWNEIDAVALIP